MTRFGVQTDEIRVRVTESDIRDGMADQSHLEQEHTCAIAQALMRLGFIGVEVHGGNRVYIGLDRYEVIDERPGGERLSRFVSDFDDWYMDWSEEVAMPETEEFVLRRVS